MTVTVGSNIDAEELEVLKEAMWAGNFEAAFPENEGATWTFIFEAPGGWLGFSLGTSAAEGDVHLSVSEWEREQHHELDRWVWVRVQDERSEEADRR